MDKESLMRVGLTDLRNLCRSLGVSPMTKPKPELIKIILAVQSGEMKVVARTSKRGRRPISKLRDFNEMIPAEEIARIAYEITKQSGINVATLTAVAFELNCSVQQIYKTFASIDLLQDAVLKLAMKKYSEYIRTEIPGELKITAVGLNYIRFAKEYPHLFKLIYLSDRQENVNIANSSLDENKNYILKLLEQEYGVSKNRVEDIYIKLGIFCNGIAFMNMYKVAKFDDAEIYRLITEVCKKLIV